ncbi:MAG TPA: hypothetical protein DCO83_03375 [Mucilaginibacter sp.]|jgi:hypothetical protein|nr:hypothetical protein [Mucilaginibacter sp.]
MKPVQPYTLKLSGYFLLLIFALQSCKEKPGTWKNDQISSGKRNDFHELSKQAFFDLKANNLLHLKILMSKELIDNPGTERMVELISNRLTDNKYDVLDEYYIINKYKDADTIKLSGAGVNSHTIRYPGVTRKTYIAFYVPAAGNNKYMITAIFGKYSYGWKLSSLDLGPYTVNGKTAPELYNLAKEEYDKRYLIDAQTTLSLAATCLKPTAVWAYTNESDISDFYGKVTAEANEKYKFPYTLNIPGRPMLLRIYNKNTDEGSFPVIYYMTHVSIADTNEVKKENMEIKKALSKLLPGIDKYNKYVYYEAFNKFPRSYESVDRFDMIDKLQ